MCVCLSTYIHTHGVDSFIVARVCCRANGAAVLLEKERDSVACKWEHGPKGERK